MIKYIYILSVIVLSYVSGSALSSNILNKEENTENRIDILKNASGSVKPRILFYLSDKEIANYGCTSKDNYKNFGGIHASIIAFKNLEKLSPQKITYRFYPNQYIEKQNLQEYLNNFSYGIDNHLITEQNIKNFYLILTSCAKKENLSWKESFLKRRYYNSQIPYLDSSQCDLVKLPLSIRFKIFSYLNEQGVINYSLTSKENNDNFFGGVFNSLIAFKNLEEFDFDYYTDKDISPERIAYKYFSWFSYMLEDAIQKGNLTERQIDIFFSQIAKWQTSPIWCEAFVNINWSFVSQQFPAFVRPKNINANIQKQLLKQFPCLNIPENIYANVKQLLFNPYNISGAFRLNEISPKLQGVSKLATPVPSDYEELVKPLPYFHWYYSDEKEVAYSITLSDKNRSDRFKNHVTKVLSQNFPKKFSLREGTVKDECDFVLSIDTDRWKKQWQPSFENHYTLKYCSPALFLFPNLEHFEIGKMNFKSLSHFPTKKLKMFLIFRNNNLESLPEFLNLIKDDIYFTVNENRKFK